jgi:anti-sigma factor RsiW
MKCEDYRVLIEDFVDGSLDPKSAARVTSHTSTCNECSGFYQELSREQDLYARYQRDVEVTPMLWASIESRIKQERPAQPQGLISRLREQIGAVFAAPRLSPAFAAALVIIAIGATVFVMSRLNYNQPRELASDNKNASITPPDGSNAPSNTVAPSTTPQPGKDNVIAKSPANASREAETGKAIAKRQAAPAMTPAQLVRDAEDKYLTAIAMLSRDVNGRRSQLDPIMLARFDASLADIDRTIKETRQVVKDNPGDPIALQYLLAAYSKKVDVLREMTNN